MAAARRCDRARETRAGVAAAAERQAHADRLSRRWQRGGVGKTAGAVRARRDAARGRDAGDVRAARAKRPSRADYAGPRQLLAPRLSGGAQGAPGAIPSSPMARGSAHRDPDVARETAWDV